MCRDKFPVRTTAARRGPSWRVCLSDPASPSERGSGCEGVQLLGASVPRPGEPSIHALCVANALAGAGTLSVTFPGVYQGLDLPDGTEPRIVMWRASVTDSTFMRYSSFFPAGRATK